MSLLTSSNLLSYCSKTIMPIMPISAVSKNLPCQVLTRRWSHRPFMLASTLTCAVYTWSEHCECALLQKQNYLHFRNIKSISIRILPVLKLHYQWNLPYLTKSRTDVDALSLEIKQKGLTQVKIVPFLKWGIHSTYYLQCYLLELFVHKMTFMSKAKKISFHLSMKH